MPSAEQIRMARAGLRISVKDLAESSGVAESTILRFEGGKGGMQTGTLEKIQKVLEKEGIIFIEADDKFGPGVRMRSKR